MTYTTASLRCGRTAPNKKIFHPTTLLTGLHDVWNEISLLEDSLLVVNNKRIYIPVGCQKKILELLHESHCGMNKTYATAKSRYYWPGLCNDIANCINKCEACQFHWVNLPNDIKVKTFANQLMEHVSINIFQSKNNHFLVMVDRFSRYPWISRMDDLSTNTTSFQS